MMSLVINVSDIKQSTYLKQPTNRERVMERGGEGDEVEKSRKHD